MWPGDRRVVGCGRYLRTWLPCLLFFLIVLYDTCKLPHSTMHSGREPGVCETNLHPTMTIFYFIVSRFDKRSSSLQIQEERIENVEVARLQIIMGLSYHHMNSITGRTLSYHHTNSFVGMTLDMRICPTTMWTKPLGGRLTQAFVLPPLRLNRWEDTRPISRRTQSLGRPFVNQSNGHVIEPLLIFHPLRTSVTMIENVDPFQPTHFHFLSTLFSDLCFIYKIECIIQTKPN